MGAAATNTGAELAGHNGPAMRRARRLQVLGLVYLISCVVVVYVVMGSSQAMKVAWMEDLLSLIPPLSFLYASYRCRRPATVEHPYGHHRAVGSAHLAAAVALLVMGLFLIYDSGMGLLKGEHPPIGTVTLFGHTFWAGWLMMGAMVYTGTGPVIFGRLKLPLSEQLHDKVLFADADMNKADWRSASAAILGILGIGLGLWWADGVAALLISTSILKDGWEQVMGAASDLTDAEARTYDDSDVHPVVDDILALTRARPWIARAGCRVRDLGHVFHAEVFVVPLSGVTVAQCDELAGAVRAADDKLVDVVVSPVAQLPDGARVKPRGLQPR